MIEKYVPSDQLYDDLYERFMLRRVQNLYKPKDTTTDDSFPFPIVTLPSAPTVVPTKGISDTNDDSGVNSSPTFSPTISSNLINHSPRTPTLNISTSHIMTAPKPPNQPLTPIQRSIHHITRKYQHKEPKFNRSQPDHLDPESVLRTRARQGYKLCNLVFL